MAGPSLLSADTPNEVIGVGCIGLGTRGGDLINAVVPVPGVKVVAVCDAYGPHRQKGVERSQNPDAKSYEDYGGIVRQNAFRRQDVRIHGKLID